MCECRPGFRYPEYIQGPYMGVAIERATEDEYNTGFHCLPNGGVLIFSLPPSLSPPSPLQSLSLQDRKSVV